MGIDSPLLLNAQQLSLLWARSLHQIHILHLHGFAKRVLKLLIGLYLAFGFKQSTISAKDKIHFTKPQQSPLGGRRSKGYILKVNSWFPKMQRAILDANLHLEWISNEVLLLHSTRKSVCVCVCVVPRPRDQIGAVAASLHYSHSNDRSKLPLWPTYTTALGNTRFLTHWARPGIKPKSSWILVRFFTTEPNGNSLAHVFFFFFFLATPGHVEFLSNARSFNLLHNPGIEPASCCSRDATSPVNTVGAP